MFKNYLKIAFRSLWKYKTNSFVSITGLAIGIGCFILLATYILHELRYDRFQENGDQIARVNLFYQSGDGEPVNVAITPTAVGPVFSREFEEIKNTVRLYVFSADGAVPVQYRTNYSMRKKSFLQILPFSEFFHFRSSKAIGPLH